MAVTDHFSRKPFAFRAFALAVVLFGMVSAAISPARADPPIPALTGRVVDQAGVLDPSTIATITAQLSGYESSTGKQVVVVTLPDLKGYPIEDWGLALGRGWGIGQKGKNNGVLLIVAPKDHAVRIEVGYGLEGILPDATANEIVQSEIIPHFKSGDIPGGIAAGVNGILAALGGSYTPTPVNSGVGAEAGQAIGQWAPFLFFGFFILMVIVTHMRRRWDPMRRRSTWIWMGGVGSGGGSSSGGGGFSSGGGFSGGGGSFGGGGASGHW
jgi:uncharacterized protein